METKNPMALKPWYAGLTAMFGGLAGLIGSIYSNQIVTVFPFCLLSGSGPEWGPAVAALLFLILLIVFGVMFATGFRAQLSSQSEAASELSEGVDSVKAAFKEQLIELEKTVRSLPPDRYLVEFEDQCQFALAEASAALACDDVTIAKQLLPEAIKTCLAAILLLAVAYDPPAKSVRYTVNIMRIRPIPPEGPERQKIVSRLQLFEQGASLDQLEGVLELLPEFMLSGVDEDPPSNGTSDALEEQLERMDAELEARRIYLPVPKPEFRFDGSLTTVIPGAPAAWCTPGALQYFADTSMLPEILRRDTALRASVAEAASQYFREHEIGKTVKSFVSLPFGLPVTGSESEPRSLGVVNVHSSATGLLGPEQAKLYAPLTSPLRSLLGLLWDRWERCGT